MSRPAFLFIRHGETDWNRDGRLQGQRDIPLNGRGRSQADEAGRRTAALLRTAGIAPTDAAFVVSPLGRTRETAERMRVAMGLPADAYVVDDRLAEFSFGAWEGFTWPEIKAREPALLRQRRADKWRFVPPGGESYAALAERVRPWLASVTDHLVVVSHGGVARALMVLVGGLSTLAAPNTEVVQGQVLVFADGATGGGEGESAELVQPLVTGVLAGIVGFASTFTVLLSALRSMGATPGQAASGLLAMCVVQGLLSIALSLWWRLPIGIVWSTPGLALLLSTGAVPGGYPAAVGATIVAAGLIAVAGLVRPFGRLVATIPAALASAMLAGILFDICLAPVQAAKANPALILPIVVAWALALRFARRYAVPIAVGVTALLVTLVVKVPPGSFAGTAPALVFTAPVFRWDLVGSLSLPLFVVTMASQNIPGLTVLRANGFQPNLGAIFAWTGLAGALNALCSGGLVNLAAITAALCAGPESHPDPARRYWSTVSAGGTYIVLGLFAAVAAAFVAAAPPALVQAVAGLALLGTLSGSLAAALAREGDRLPVAVTFVVTASGLSLFGIGASFWGLLAGGLLMAIERLPGPRAVSPPQGSGLVPARK